MAGLKYWVWLSEVKGLTNRSKLLLLDYFGTPENVYYADEDEYRLVEGIEPRQIALLAEKSLENADRILGACSRLGLRLLTMQDADYPMRLRNIFEPSCLLYVKGQLPVIDEEVAVAMVGTRKASPYGIEAAEKIAYGLCKQGAVVISGAAAGVDSAARCARAERPSPCSATGWTLSIPRRMNGCTAISRPRARSSASIRPGRRPRRGIFPCETASSAA